MATIEADRQTVIVGTIDEAIQQLYLDAASRVEQGDMGMALNYVERAEKLETLKNKIGQIPTV